MITQERVKELFEYRDGDLVWKVKRRGRFAKPGVVAGCKTDKYIWISVDCRSYAAHKLVFLYHYGYIPKEIDHINQIKTDNRIENLRPCTRSQNTGNVGLRSTNTSGYRGIWFAKHCGKWRASIKKKGKSTHLGYFNTREEAAEAYDTAAKDYFGEFAYINHGD